MNFAEGQTVTPAESLVEIRPELAGERGVVERLEPGDQAVVKWNGQEKPYRVVLSNLEAARGD
jgi:hypothetical protein